MSSLWGRSMLSLLCCCATGVLLGKKSENILRKKIVGRFLVFGCWFLVFGVWCLVDCVGFFMYANHLQLQWPFFIIHAHVTHRIALLVTGIIVLLQLVLTKHYSQVMPLSTYALHTMIGGFLPPSLLDCIWGHKVIINIANFHAPTDLKLMVYQTPSKAEARSVPVFIHPSMVHLWGGVWPVWM